MFLKDLKVHISDTIRDFKDNGIFPKENNIFDFKLELNFFNLTNPIEIFLRNFAKDILAFSNSNGGIIILGIKEDKILGVADDVGLDEKNIQVLNKLDINDITQKFEKIVKIGVDIDIQCFNVGMRKFFYILVGKQNQILIPTQDFLDYKIKKGEVIYRTSSKNEIANLSTQDFNRFLQIKVNEKSNEFMQIWSKLLPQIFDINPREILIINPANNVVYGFNQQENVLSSSSIDIDNSSTGVFNIILHAIAAGEIGKISDDEGKPLYKIVGEVKSLAPREYISISTLYSEALRLSKFKFSSAQIKSVIKYLGWVSDDKFKVENPPSGTLNLDACVYIWLETLDTIKDSHKVVFSKEAVNKIVEIVNQPEIHQVVFNRKLELRNNS